MAERPNIETGMWIEVEQVRCVIANVREPDNRL